MSRRETANRISQMANHIAQPNIVGPDIAGRAGRFLDSEFEGAHRNKRIAQQHQVSPGMAKHLRAGRGWTVARLNEAMQLYGGRFVEAVFGPVPPADALRRDVDELRRRLARLEEADPS